MQPISKNFYKGEPITNPMDIKRLALEKRSVYHYTWGIVSASFVLSQQLMFIINAIEKKQIFYTYK